MDDVPHCAETHDQKASGNREERGLCPCVVLTLWRSAHSQRLPSLRGCNCFNSSVVE
jgi:hypothetical protein